MVKTIIHWCFQKNVNALSKQKRCEDLLMIINNFFSDYSDEQTFDESDI